MSTDVRRLALGALFALLIAMTLGRKEAHAAFPANENTEACTANCLQYAALWGTNLPWFNTTQALVGWTIGQTIYGCQTSSAYVRPHPTVGDAWQIVINGKWAQQNTQACSVAHNLATRWG